MVKILYVTDGVAPYVIGGMQTVARRHIGWLTEAGYDVYAVVPESPAVPIGALAATFVPIPWRKRKLRDTINPWRYVHDLRVYGRRVAGLVDQIRPDIVYSEGPLIDPLLDRPRDHQAPIVFHPHGLEMFQDLGSAGGKLRSLPLRGIVARHARRADIVISQGGRLDDLLIRLIGVPPGRIRQLLNTAVSGRAPDVTNERHGSSSRFLFVGRNEPRKGLPLLIKAMSALPMASLEVVGVAHPGGSPSGNVTFHGEIRDQELLASFYGRADFLVVPSSAEGMPTVILEAFSNGLPAIASNVGAVASAVMEGHTGFLVRPRDLEGLVGAMRRAIALSDDEYHAMSTASRAAMGSDFSPVRVRSRFLDIIDEAAVLSRVRKLRA